jgi:hypothetical protein
MAGFKLGSSSMIGFSNVTGSKVLNQPIRLLNPIVSLKVSLNLDCG